MRHLRYELFDVLAAMNGAWLINSAMIVMAAAVFYKNKTAFNFDLAHLTLQPILPAVSGTAFALALPFSGLSSSTVGTMAGQVIIEGFLDIKFSVPAPPHHHYSGAGGDLTKTRWPSNFCYYLRWC